MSAAYVKTSEGFYLLQIPDPESQWGFYLADEDQAWDGGLGIATEWEIVDASEVPAGVRKNLDWRLE